MIARLAVVFVVVLVLTLAASPSWPAVVGLAALALLLPLDRGRHAEDHAPENDADDGRSDEVER